MVSALPLSLVVLLVLFGFGIFFYIQRQRR